MKQFLFFLLFALYFSFSVRAQNKRILYVVPDSVEILAEQHIQMILKKSSNKKFYFLLEIDTSNIYRLTIIPFDRKEIKTINPWVFSSNRVVNVDNKQYPVLTSFDFKFATIDPDNIGEYGSRDGNVKRTNLITHDYTIVFNKGTGEVIKIENR